MNMIEMAWQRSKKFAKRAWGVVKKRYGSKKGLRRLAKDVMFLKSVVNVEHKYFDFSGTSVPTQASTVATHLGPITQGTGVNARTGDSIKCSSIQIKGRLTRDGSISGLTAPHNYRQILVVDHEPNVGSLQITDILESEDIASLRKFSTAVQKRFTVLYDKTYSFDNNRNQITYNLYKKLRMHMRFTPGLSTVSNNRLIFYQMTDYTGASPTSVMTNTYNSRLRFVDN